MVSEWSLFYGTWNILHSPHPFSKELITAPPPFCERRGRATMASYCETRAGLLALDPGRGVGVGKGGSE